MLHYESSQYTGLKLSTDVPFKRTTSIQPQTMMLHYESSQYTGLKLSTDVSFKRTTSIQPQWCCIMKVLSLQVWKRKSFFSNLGPVYLTVDVSVSDGKKSSWGISSIEQGRQPLAQLTLFNRAVGYRQNSPYKCTFFSPWQAQIVTMSVWQHTRKDKWMYVFTFNWSRCLLWLCPNLTMLEISFRNLVITCTIFR